ncbi:MAG: hypothetical protein ACKO96_49325, partial [Flammeovirgaceae bacterium]
NPKTPLAPYINLKCFKIYSAFLIASQQSSLTELRNGALTLSISISELTANPFTRHLFFMLTLQLSEVRPSQ